MCQLIFELPEELPPALDIPEYRWSLTGNEGILDIYALCGCHEVVAEKTTWNSKPPRYPSEPVYMFLVSLPTTISSGLYLANRGLAIGERWTSGDTWRPLSMSTWAGFGV